MLSSVFPEDKIYVAVIHDYDPSHVPQFRCWVPGMCKDLLPGQIILVCKERKKKDQFWIPAWDNGPVSVEIPFPPYALHADCLTIIGELQ